jgi:lysophospholipase L1-like esterase
VTTRSTRVRALTRWLPAALGWLAIVVVLDLLAGVFLLPWDDTPPAGPGGVIPLTDGTVTPEDQRPSLPAMQGVPWAAEYWGEFNLLRGEYQPFSRFLPADARGEFFNITDNVRESYQGAGAMGAAVPEVWFIGGSTMFGQGQRDQHTIPSEVARLAESEGVAVRVVNLGALGATSWEGMNRLLAQLAAGPAPALVVTYEGVNDVNVVAEQRLAGRDDLMAHPGHYSSPVDAGFAGAGETAASIELLDRTWWERYRDTSALGQVLHGVLGAAVTPAAAQTDPGAAELAELAADHVRRSQLLISDLGADAGFATLYTSQPWRAPEAPLVAEHLRDTTVDLSGAFEGVPVDEIYLDGGHTNELGAVLVAEAMWPHVRRALQDA